MARELLVSLLADRVKQGVLSLAQVPDWLREEVEVVLNGKAISD